MPANLGSADLLAALKTKAGALGLRLQDAGDGFSGDMETIVAKWMLGGRKVTYKMSLRLTEAERTVNYREMVTEKSWGLPPPTLTVETTSTSGWKRSGSRTDRSVGGGGTLDYGRVREALQNSVTDAGWQFRLEGGRAP